MILNPAEIFYVYASPVLFNVMGIHDCTPFLAASSRSAFSLQASITN